MSDITRQNQIMEILNEEKSVSVSKLIKRLYVSPATIRRDLEDMAKKGLLKRVHGGAILFASKNEESSIITRSKTMVQEKRAIAASTINFLKNNQYIKKIEQAVEMKGAGDGGADVALIYRKDVDAVSLEIPMPFTQYAPQASNLEFVVPCESRTAGVIVYYPLSMCTIVGI